MTTDSRIIFIKMAKSYFDACGDNSNKPAFLAAQAHREKIIKVVEELAETDSLLMPLAGELKAKNK